LFGTDLDPKPRLRDRYPGQVYILHDRPDDGQTTGFCVEGINLIRSLANIAKEAFNGVGTPNIAVHHWWKRIKRQEMFFIDASAADGFGIALLIFGECSRPN
jgi:hypothetical protein